MNIQNINSNFNYKVQQNQQVKPNERNSISGNKDQNSNVEVSQNNPNDKCC